MSVYTYTDDQKKIMNDLAALLNNALEVQKSLPKLIDNIKGFLTVGNKLAFMGIEWATGLIPLFGDPNSKHSGVHHFVIEALYCRVYPV